MSNGFLAKNFISFLSKNDIHPFQISRNRDEISVIRADMSKCGNWQEKIKDLSPSVIIHFAGPSRPIDEDDVDKNMLLATNNLLNSLEGCSVFFLHLSSSAVYGEAMNETKQITEHSNCLTTDLYGEGKLKQEKLLINFANKNKNNFKLCVCRPTNIIGLGQSSSFFLGKLMNSLKEISNRDDFDIEKKYQLHFGSLGTKRDFLDVRDLNSILYKLSSIKPAGTFNISRGEDYLLRDLVEIVIKKSFIHAEIKENVENFKTNIIKKQVVSSKKLNELIDWKGYLPIDQTLNDIMRELEI